VATLQHLSDSSQSATRAVSRPVRAARVRGVHPRDRRPLPRRPRSIGPDDARLIRYATQRDRQLLPRRQPNKTGIHIQAPPGAYARLPCWNSRDDFLAFVVPLMIRRHRDVLHRWQIDPDTFRYLIRQWTLYADNQATGRHVIVRPVTLAKPESVDG
jgi:hypothetical protein